MTELVLFMAVGVIAVAAAGYMLWSDNAVHSALSLIVTMGCISVLFLMLNAPFLAMIQITVYAGAIMVLFLFVIMLLGADRLNADRAEARVERRFRWFIPVATALALGFGLILGIVFLTGDLTTRDLPGSPPDVRVMNVANAGAIAVFANDEPVAADVDFGDVSPYAELSPGDYTFSVRFEDGRVQDIPATLDGDSAQTLIVYGEGEETQAALVADDLTTVSANRSQRITVFNAYNALPAVQVVDFGSDFVEDDTTIIVDDLAPGQVSEAFFVEEGAVNWSFIQAGNENNILTRMSNHPVERDESSLIVLAAEPTFDGVNNSTRPMAIPVTVEARPAFGGPRAIGYLLFTDFMLPFQLLGLLLLASMIGAIVLTHREAERAKGRGVTRRRVSRPLVNVIAAQVGHDVGGQGGPAQLPGVIEEQPEQVKE